MAAVTDVGVQTAALSVPSPDEPFAERIRHNVRIRDLVVMSVVSITPAMLRVTFGGDDLADFDSRGFDDHVKLLLPIGDGQVERRNYTPRRFDKAAGTLAIDFALHDAGPATSWARHARPGDRLEIAGPKGSRIVSPDVRRWLLIGDETALPAIGRFLEEAVSGTEVISLIAVSGVKERQPLATAAGASVHWVHRSLDDAADAGPLLSALAGIELAPATYAWIAAEDQVTHSVREGLLARGFQAPWLRAASYWRAERPMCRGQRTADQSLGLHRRPRR